MRYVLINEWYNLGGAEVQALREKHLMESKGHKVLYITLDKNFPQGWDKNEPNHFNIAPAYTKNIRRLYTYIRDRSLSRQLKSLIDSFFPDFIHLNNPITYSYVISHCCKNYPSFNTIRDYSAVCPLGFCTDRNNRICKGARNNNCIKKCMPTYHKREFLSDCFKYHKRMLLQKNAFSFFACPSRTLTKYCCRNGIQTYCINNPIDLSIIDLKQALQKNGTVRRFFFYGFISEHKGVFELISAFKEFSKGKDVTLEIAGEVSDDIKGKFTEAISGCNAIVYHGKKAYSDIIALLSEIDCVVVPSKWMENYPNTVLEGLSTGCIVLASDRGGMKEMIRDNRMIFDVLDKRDIISKLEFAYGISETERADIIRRNIGYVTQNNSIEMYYKRFMKLVSKLINENRQ